jgi:primosomal protein N'
LGYPPFVQIVRLEYRHANIEQAEKAGKEMASQVENWLKIEGRRATHLLGPYPPFFAKSGGMNRVQIILRGPDPASIFRNKERMSLISEWHVEVNPPSLL